MNIPMTLASSIHMTVRTPYKPTTRAYAFSLFHSSSIFEMKGHLARKSDCCLAEIKDTPMFTVHLLLPLLYNQRGL